MVAAAVNWAVFHTTGPCEMRFLAKIGMGILRMKIRSIILHLYSNDTFIFDNVCISFGQEKS